MKASRTHRARKELFQRGLRQGFLLASDIEREVPSGALSGAERWLLYYSLRASGIEIRDGRGAPVERHDYPPSAE